MNLDVSVIKSIPKCIFKKAIYISKMHFSESYLHSGREQIFVDFENTYAKFLFIIKKYIVTKLFHFWIVKKTWLYLVGLCLGVESWGTKMS